MGGTAIAGGLELRCTFAEGSQAQSCILTVCRLESGALISCMNITINREDPQRSGQIMNLQPGLYVVREVAEVESDGRVTTLNRRDVLELMSLLITTTSIIPGMLKLCRYSNNHYFLFRKPNNWWCI